MELELKCSDTGDYKTIDYLRPSRSLQRFTLIKRLSIPQGVLINSTPYECSPLHPFEALPPNVEYLNVADPTTAMIQWISGVLDDRSKLRSLKGISLDFDNDPKQRVKDYKEAGVQIFGRLLEAGISVHFENAIMLDASNMEPITGDRKAYFEDLRKNHIPQFLFRTWSSNSGGGSEHATNSVKEIIPHGFMKKASGSGFYDKPESELYKMVQDHYDTESVFTSEFSSWTGSLHLALCYAGSIEEEYGPHVAIMDTHQLDGDVLVWHVPHLFKPDGLHEYLAHGPIRGIGYKAVSYKTLMSAGLAQIFPELLETDLDDWGMSLRDQMFNGPPIPLPKDNIEKSDEMKQIQSIANLYGHLYLPVATSLMCLRLRPWLGSRAEGEVALDKIANLFANTKPAKDISRGNWLCEGVVLTESPMGPHNFPDVRQWIKLLRAISERTD
ncbi:uncharacterized protein J4E88_008267 [Alternaria novae-zelandiae]|uniref:uncharacterized protein n=1 Tax=Alternaria novae-zelandiae TaxID=430562 RepID=UPI0020C2249E|nr:uncharacterized protein J4E88_008267 [Alternaria novae-zelandiae]KAI4674531.1 hypothetical protein J4E88_008267 [Alternaria novae-zelandiae]